MASILFTPSAPLTVQYVSCLQTRTEKRFRYGGGGTINEMTITYEVATQVAVGAAAWKPDSRA